MAQQAFEEVLRIIVEQQGESEIGKLAASLLQAGKSGALAADDVSKFADEISAVSARAGQIDELRGMAEAYDALAQKSESASAEVEKAGLRLQIAAQAEQAAADAVAERARALADAEAKQAEYTASAGAAAAAVRDAASSQKEANAEWKAAGKDVAAASKAFEKVAAAQGLYSDEAERAGLRLKLATEQEQAASAALKQRSAELTAAKAAQAEYADGQTSIAQAVKNAASALKDANAEWRSAGNDVRAATGAYDQAAGAQQRITRQMGDLDAKLTDAGIATRDLAGAQRELSERSASAEKAIGGIAEKAREMAEHQSALADESKRAAQEQTEYAAALKRAEANAASAAKETRNLGDSANAATGLFGKLRGMLASVAGVLSFATLVKGVKSVVSAGSDAEQAMGQLEAAIASTGGAAGYTADQLLKMADDATKTSKFTTEQLVSMQVRLLSYTDVVGQQFPEAMQIAIDQAARLGISVEQSAEIVGKALQDPVNAMSALSRQGFKLEESQKSLLKQLQATGKMAEAQAVIMDMLRESYAGAAAAQSVGTLEGAWDQLNKSIAEFRLQIANAGVVDHFRQQIELLNETIKAMAADGRLDKWVKATSDAIIGASKAIGGAVKFLYDYSAALVALAKAYALVKVNQFVTGLSLVASGATKAGGAVQLLSLAITKIPLIRLLILGGAGIALAKDQIDSLSESIARNLPQSKALAARVAELRAEASASAERIGEAAQRFQQFADVQLKSAESIAKMSDAQRQAYSEARDGLEQYLQLQVRYYEQLRRNESLNADGLAYLESLKERLASAQAATENFAAAVTLAGTAAASGLTIGAQKIRDDLAGIETDSARTKEALGKMFDGFDRLSAEKLGDAALALQSLGESGAAAGDRIRDSLGVELKKLSADDLKKFQSAAQSAFDEVGRSGDRASVVLGVTLRTALENLKVDAGKTGEAFTRAGRDILTSFDTVVSNAQATAGQIEAAFTAALAGVNTREEAQALGAQLERVGEQGRVSGAVVERAMSAVRDRVRDIGAELDPLAAKFQRFGMQTQASLNDAAASAREFYEQVAAGAKAGEYAQEDVIRAFRKWAEAARAAAADSSEAMQEPLERQIEMQASALGLTKELERVGSAGSDAGKKVAESFKEAGDEVERTARAAGSAADASDAVASANDRAAASARRIADEYQGVVVLTQTQNDTLRQMTDELRRNGDIQGLSLDEAKRMLEEIGDLSIGQADLLRRRIDELQSVADRAVQATARMASEAAAIQDQIDQMRGDNMAVEARRHERKLADLRAEAEATGQLNSAAYAELIAKANELHDLKMAQIRKESEARRKADVDSATASSSKPSGGEPSVGKSQSSDFTPVAGSLTGPDGKVFHVRGNKDTRDDLAAMLREFQRARAVYGGR